jgi:hypothetical protein
MEVSISSQKDSVSKIFNSNNFSSIDKGGNEYYYFIEVFQVQH